MNKMQKEWLKTVGLIAGAILYLIVILVTMCLGEEWLWISLILTLLVTIPIFIYGIIYVPIANMIWYWRLMGACITDEDEELLRTWWFWIKRSDYCADYLWNEIQEMKDEELREGAEDLRTRLMCVKKPKWI